LLAASWVISLKGDSFVIFGIGFSDRGQILTLGGGFLVPKAARVIRRSLERAESHGTTTT